MATYKILYWKEIPSQISVEDAEGDVTVVLGPKFSEHIDATAEKLGLNRADDYIAQWHWSDEEERDGTAQEVADALQTELEAKANW